MTHFLKSVAEDNLRERSQPSTPIKVTILVKLANRQEPGIVKVVDRINKVFPGTVTTLLLEIKGYASKPLELFMEFRKHFTDHCGGPHKYELGAQVALEKCESMSKASGWADIVRYQFADEIYFFHPASQNARTESITAYPTLMTNAFDKCKQLVRKVNPKVKVGFMATYSDTGLDAQVEDSNLVRFWRHLDSWAGMSETSLFLLQAFDSPLEPDINMKTNGWWRLVPNSSYREAVEFIFQEKISLPPQSQSKSEYENVNLTWLGEETHFNRNMVGVNFQPTFPRKTFEAAAPDIQSNEGILMEQLSTKFSKILISFSNYLSAPVYDSLGAVTRNVALWNKKERRHGNKSIQLFVTFDESSANQIISLSNEANSLHNQTVTHLIYVPDPTLDIFARNITVLNFLNEELHQMGNFQVGIQLSLELSNSVLQFENVLSILDAAVNYTYSAVYFRLVVTADNSQMGLEHLFPQLIALFERYKRGVEDRLKNGNRAITVGFVTGWPETAEGSLKDILQFVNFWEGMNDWAVKTSTAVFLINAFDGPVSVKGQPKYGWWRLVEGSSDLAAPKFENKKEVAWRYAQAKMQKETSVPSFSFMLYISIFIMALTLVISLICILYRRRKRDPQYLTEADIAEFFAGGETKLFGNAAGDVDGPYNKELYELPNSSFQINEASSLGSGEFGKVCRGSIQKGGGITEKVAVKMTKVPCTRSAFKGLIYEIKILSYLGQHPNIVELKGVYSAELKRSKLLVFLELCTLGSLKGYLSKFRSLGSGSSGSALEPETASLESATETDMETEGFSDLLANDFLRWSWEIASGMEYIAGKQVVHMDLAARNILLTASKTVKITDFGLSRRLYANQCYSKNRQEQEPLPWRSMSPESLRRLEFTEKSDVWAFGVTLWEMLTLGDEPYAGLQWNPNFVAQLENGLRLERPAKDEYYDMYSVMLCCWAASPGGRPNFSELVKTLGSIGNRLNIPSPEIAIIFNETTEAETGNLPRDQNPSNNPPSQREPCSTAHSKANSKVSCRCSRGMLRLSVGSGFLLIFIASLIVATFTFLNKDDGLQPKNTTSPSLLTQVLINLQSNISETEGSGFENGSYSLNTDLRIGDHYNEFKRRNWEWEPLTNDADNITSLFQMLTNSTMRMGSMEFHGIVKSLVHSNSTELLNSRGGNQNATFLDLVLLNVENLLEESISLLYQAACFNFNLLDRDGESALFYAVKGRQSLQVLSALIRSGANWKQSNTQQRSILYCAVQFGRAELLPFLLNLGLDVNAIDLEGNGPLHIALKTGQGEAFHFHILRFLVESGADVKLKNKDGESPLIAAAKHSPDTESCLKTIQYLMEFKADPFASYSRHDETFLHLLLEDCSSNLTSAQLHHLAEDIISNGHSKLFNIRAGNNFATPFQLAVKCLEVAEPTLLLLSQNGVDFNAEDHSDLSVLFYAVKYGRSGSFISGLTGFGANAKYRTSSGYGMLHVAASSGNIEALEFALDLGLDVNAVDDFKDSPLYEVARQCPGNALEVIKFLVDNGADVNGKGRYGDPALIYFAGNREMETSVILKVITLLIENGADVFGTDELGRTFLHSLLLYKRTSISPGQLHHLAEYLDEGGHSHLFNIPDGFGGVTPLHLALQEVDVEERTLHLLKTAGLDFNGKDGKGRSILFYAVQGNRSLQHLSTLLSLGSDPTQLDSYNQSLLHIAAEFRDLEAFKFLLNLNLDMAGTDVDEETPLHRAANAGNELSFKIIEFLVENGLSVDSRNVLSMTPLHRASHIESGDIHEARFQIIRYLMGAGTNIFLEDDSNLTFLHSLLAPYCRLTPSQLHNMTEFLVAKGYSRIFDESGGFQNQTPLHSAAEHCEVKRATLYLLKQSGVNFNAIDKYGNSVLFYAVKGNRSPALLSRLIDLGGEWKQLNWNNRSLVHQAAVSAGVSLLRFLLDLGLDINAPDMDQLTPLHHFATLRKENEVLQVARLLLGNGADVNAKSGSLWTPLHCATFNRNLDEKELIIRYLIENGAGLYAKTNRNLTFLHQLFTDGSNMSTYQLQQFCKYLVAKGHSPLFQVPGGMDYSTPMHLAVRKLELARDTLRQLRSKYVNFNVINKEGESVLYAAVEGGRTLDFISTMIRLGASYTMVTHDNRNLLHAAAKSGGWDVLQFFVSKELDVNRADVDGNTPLHFAAAFERENIFGKVKSLLKAGAKGNPVNLAGLTPLAVLSGRKGFSWKNDAMVELERADNNTS